MSLVSVSSCFAMGYRVRGFNEGVGMHDQKRVVISGNFEFIALLNWVYDGVNDGLIALMDASEHKHNESHLVLGIEVFGLAIESIEVMVFLGSIHGNEGGVEALATVDSPKTLLINRILEAISQISAI